MDIAAARADDAPALVELLSHAMVGDPFVEWLARPGPAHERARRSYVQLMLERIALPRGRVWVAREAGAIVGAALWAPPRSFELGAGETLRILPLMMDVVGFRRLPRIAGVLDEIDAARPPEPRWLLTIVGVDPAWRGRGIGAALLAPALRLCDADELPAVAETASAANLPFYARLGFAVSAERALSDGGPTSWTLVRPSAAIIGRGSR